MRPWLRACVIAMLSVLWASAPARPADGRPPLLLSGEPLTLEEIVEVAQQGRPVELAPAARARVGAAFEAVLAAARAHQPVYGLTTGVGWNKDQDVLSQTGGLDPELLAASRRFNLGTLRAHAAGVGAPLPDDVVRAAMLVRLNLLLTGAGGGRSVRRFPESWHHAGGARARQRG